MIISIKCDIPQPCSSNNAKDSQCRIFQNWSNLYPFSKKYTFQTKKHMHLYKDGFDIFLIFCVTHYVNGNNQVNMKIYHLWIHFINMISKHQSQPIEYLQYRLTFPKNHLVISSKSRKITSLEDRWFEPHPTSPCRLPSRPRSM